jgi:hypothetical protein
VNPWICIVSIWQFSKDSICRFDLWCSSQKILFADLICDAVFKRLNSQIQFVTEISKDLTNPTNPHKSLVHRRTLDKRILNFWIRESVWSFKRFDLKIQFLIRFSKDSICGFHLWTIKSKKIWLVSIRKDSYTNPASLSEYL